MTGQRHGADRVVLEGYRGRNVVARQAVQLRISPVAQSETSVIAMGDSVTAGFGYFGETGKQMGITQLLGCRPGSTTYNDACSSNSSNRTNKGSTVDYLPDYGLARNIAWPAQWANKYGITDYKNFAVSGSAPADWLEGGQFAGTTDRIATANPDYIVMTMGANPLLSNMLFGIDNMKCAIESDLFGDYRKCIEDAFSRVDLRENLKALYAKLVEATDSHIILMQYHLSIPGSALAYSSAQIEMMGHLMNQAIEQVADEVSEDRISVVSPPRFFVGIDMEPLYKNSYSCSIFDFGVDGRSVQSNFTQNELLVNHPASFCSGPAKGPPWVISGDTGIHPSATGHSRMASRMPAPR